MNSGLDYLITTAIEEQFYRYLFLILTDFFFNFKNWLAVDTNEWFKKHSIVKGKFFSEDITLLVRSPIFANILQLWKKVID